MSDSSIIPWLAVTSRSRRSVVEVEGAGIGVGEEAGLLDHHSAGGDEVVDGRGVAALGQPPPGARITVLGALAQGEERFVTARLLPGAGDGEYVVEIEVGRGQPSRGFGERAVPTPVAAQHREGDEDLGREGDPVGVRGVADGPSPGHELVERRRLEIATGHRRRRRA